MNDKLKYKLINSILKVSIRNGLKQKDLSELSGCSIMTISNIFNYKLDQLSLKMLFHIMELLSLKYNIEFEVEIIVNDKT